MGSFSSTIIGIQYKYLINYTDNIRCGTDIMYYMYAYKNWSSLNQISHMLAPH